MAINSSGQIVGQSEISGNVSGNPNRATIWNGNIATDLNVYLDASMLNAGWLLYQARAVNDDGWIVGNAANLFTHEEHAFLLIPVSVPEPATLALILFVLGVVGFTGAGKKQKTIA